MIELLYVYYHNTVKMVHHCEIYDRAINTIKILLENNPVCNLIVVCIFLDIIS